MRGWARPLPRGFVTFSQTGSRPVGLWQTGCSAGRATDPGGRADALPLRLMGALHGVVIEARDPDLTLVYPPHDAADDALWSAVAAALGSHAAWILRRLDGPPQTNEVQRSAALCPGFLVIAARKRLPLVTSELGASAGLNQLWDRFSYRFGDIDWGDPTAPVRLQPDWEGPAPPVPEIEVAGRAACDRNPPDLSRAEDRQRLLSFVWADQTDRMARMAAAIELATATGISVIRADAVNWLADRLSRPHSGHVHVVYHSIFWQYLAADDQARAACLLNAHGLAANAAAPLAWLRFEGDGDGPGGAITLTLWPGAETRTLGRADFHGRWVRWTGWTRRS